MYENMTPGTELPRDFCAGIGPRQLGVVLLNYKFHYKLWPLSAMCFVLWYMCSFIYLFITDLCFRIEDRLIKRQITLARFLLDSYFQENWCVNYVCNHISNKHNAELPRTDPVQKLWANSLPRAPSKLASAWVHGAPRNLAVHPSFKSASNFSTAADQWSWLYLQ